MIAVSLLLVLRNKGGWGGWSMWHEWGWRDAHTEICWGNLKDRVYLEALGICDVVRLSKELVGHRSIWRRSKYLRLCFADNYWSWFIVKEATIHTVANYLVWVQLKIVQASRDNSKVVPNMWTNASDFSGWRSPAQFPNPLLHNYL